MTIENARTLLGQSVRGHRKSRGITQAELAAKTGVSTQTINLIEAGKTWPEYENLQAIAQALGTTIEGVLGMKPVTVEKSAKLRLFEAVAKLNEAQAEVLLPLIENAPTEEQIKADALEFSEIHKEKRRL